MKRTVLRFLGKAILAVSPLLWKIPTKWAFNLHQTLGDIAIKWHHEHNLDLWDENHVGI